MLLRRVHYRCNPLEFVLAGIVCLAAGPLLNAAEERGGYDVLFVSFDDLNDWIGPLGGHPQTQTPNFDRLAEMAITFTNAQCAASVCNPSRTALMTGIAPQVSGVYNNFQLFREAPLLKDALTIPQYFAAHGYQTMARGKIFHHATGVFADQGSWIEWVEEQGQGQVHPDRTSERMANGLPILPGLPNNLDWAPLDVPAEAMTDYRNAQWAAEWLMDADRDAATFLACGIFRPHLPWFVPKEYFDRFPLDAVELPPVRPDDLDDIPFEGRLISGGLNPKCEVDRLSSHGKTKEAVRAYLASVAFADECLGVILDAYENGPRRDKTILVVWGDHGFHLGEKLRYKKETLWEESTRTPLFVLVPGLTRAGTRVEMPVSLIDLYPTLVDLAGLPEKAGLSGHSLRPLLEDPEAEWNHPAVTTIGRGFSLRTKDWRYIRYLDGSEELYDHRKDPEEWVNLANDPFHAATLERLRSKIPTSRATPIPFFQN